MNQESEVDLIDLRQVYLTLRRNLQLIFAIVATITVLTLVVTLQLTPLYTASAKVLIETRENNVVDIEAVLSGLSSDSATIDSQVEIIRSQALALRVIETLELEKDPEFNAALREDSWLSSLNPIALLRSLLPKAPVDEEEARQAELISIVDAFSDRLNVSRTGLTKVISINFTSEVPRKAERIANAVADAYLVDQLEAKYEATQRATMWLDSRLQDLREQVQSSEEAAELYRAARS